MLIRLFRYWFAIQVYNANQAITKLEVSSDGKTWQSCVRQTYNYWLLASGTGTSTVSVRVTAENGVVVTTANVPTAGGKEVTAAKNFV
jgi:expansin (peptidoglycan-binding protein)